MKKELEVFVWFKTVELLLIGLLHSEMRTSQHCTGRQLGLKGSYFFRRFGSLIAVFVIVGQYRREIMTGCRADWKDEGPVLVAVNLPIRENIHTSFSP
jgi:hypothetical protein